MFPESGTETRPNNTPAGSRGDVAPGTEGGSSADLSSSLSQSIEDMSEDMVGYCAHLADVMGIWNLVLHYSPEQSDIYT